MKIWQKWNKKIELSHVEAAQEGRCSWSGGHEVLSHLLPSSVCRSRPESRRAPAAVERRDWWKRAQHGRQRHQAQQCRQHGRRQRRRPGPVHQQLFFNYLLLQSRQSIAAHLAPFHRQRTVPHPQPQKRAREGARKRAREVNHVMRALVCLLHIQSGDSLMLCLFVL